MNPRREKAMATKKTKVESGGTAVMETGAGEKRNRSSHPVPLMEDDAVNAGELDFKARGRTTKYATIVESIRNLAKQKVTREKLPGLTFRPADGEDAMRLKMRLASLVSRNCEAPEGCAYRVRVTQDNSRVVVFLEKSAE